MAAGQEVQVNDLPDEIKASSESITPLSGQWQDLLADWARKALKDGQKEILNLALPEFERVLIRETLTYTAGKKQEAAALLGWGRNTLTRKIKELDMGETKEKTV
jgi:two-component system nitrogen regulation response regulator GlnG